MSADNYVEVDYEDGKWLCAMGFASDPVDAKLQWHAVDSVDKVHEYIEMCMPEYGVRWSSDAIEQKNREQGIIHITRDDLIAKLTGRTVARERRNISGRSTALPPVEITGYMAVIIANILSGDY